MDRCVVLVDAGYLLGAAASLLAGEPARSRITVDHAALIQGLRERAENDTEQRLLRIYWFDGAPDRRAAAGTPQAAGNAPGHRTARGAHPQRRALGAEGRRRGHARRADRTGPQPRLLRYRAGHRGRRSAARPDVRQGAWRRRASVGGAGRRRRLQPVRGPGRRGRRAPGAGPDLDHQGGTSQGSRRDLRAPAGAAPGDRRDPLRPAARVLAGRLG